MCIRDRDRAEEDLREFLKDRCREAGKTDIEAALNECIQALGVQDAPFRIAITNRLSFSDWKPKHKSEMTKRSREKGLEKRTPKKVASPA